METINIINNQVNIITAIKTPVMKETTYQKLKRLSKKYNLQTNDAKFARSRWLAVTANSNFTRDRDWILFIMVIIIEKFLGKLWKMRAQGGGDRRQQGQLKITWWWVIICRKRGKCLVVSENSCIFAAWNNKERK